MKIEISVVSNVIYVNNEETLESLLWKLRKAYGFSYLANIIERNSQYGKPVIIIDEEHQ